MKKMSSIKIENELNLEQLNDIQVVLLDQDIKYLYISFPKNEELNKILTTYNGKWNKEKFCWGIPIKNKKEFLDKLETCNYNTIKYEKPIYGKNFL